MSPYGLLRREAEQQQLAALMESMSHEAIDELVESAFDKADLDRDDWYVYADTYALAKPVPHAPICTHVQAPA